MNGVAAKVAEEVHVFFEDSDGDTLACQEESEHDAGRTSADDAAGGGEVISGCDPPGGLRARVGKCVKTHCELRATC